MNKTTFRTFFLRGSLTSVLLLTTVYCGFIRQAKTLAACPTNASRNPYNLTTSASIAAPHKIQVSWEACQKNDFYEVSWSDNKEDTAKINDPAARSWTYTRARDLARYTFRVRGCNAAKDTAKEADCTPWSEVKVQAPDW
ncbi:hypothetical protein G7B40_002900 [Aetokthonos hydrillicola Thurmond2011]|uniref:Fibronectin type-III domain-containing protein n=1 Tax=Aetokthonos hydrillicola Thurmond2011 TaxID=2712845 RepID=A0AAP5I6U6_9CYAN|nr:hypothetical protein [Aetokthonos hydrillicola]MBO3459376.1 hypothetical protein [Aetokthonos hydrillicola CCALA 1050]MBW4586522.1 hypothetical protein [Aetokthonos hydrillicola CCALA 1050]MDR9893535.1 hypothetical protein [Aetokthonos hydrillicola Thurmond2011]